MNNKENQEKVGSIENLNQSTPSYVNNSKDIPKTFFKTINQVQQEQTEYVENYQREKNIPKRDVPDLSGEVRKLQKELKKKQFSMSPLAVLILLMLVNGAWFLSIKFIIEPKYENYIKESKEIKENYDELKRHVDAIVGN